MKDLFESIIEFDSELKALFESLNMLYPGAWSSFSENEKVALEIKQDNDLPLLMNWPERFKKNYEGASITLSRRYANYIEPHLISLATYFFNFCPSPQNIYIKFCEKLNSIIDKNPTILCTLNYDLLLQRAIEKSNLAPVLRTPRGFLSFNSVVKSKKVELILPHGSCNFFVPGTSENARIVRQTLDTDQPLVVREEESFFIRIGNQLPIISNLTPEKNSINGETFINFQKNIMKQAIGEVDKIAIIGVQVRDWDKHIWSPLAETKAKILYCTLGNANDFMKWSKKYGREDPAPLVRGFADELEEITKFLSD